HRRALPPRTRQRGARGARRPQDRGQGGARPVKRIDHCARAPHSRASPARMLSAATMLDVLSNAQAHGGAPERWARDVPDLLTTRAPGTLAVEAELYRASDRALLFLGERAASPRSRDITLTGHASLTADECRRIYETSTFVCSTRGFFDGAPPTDLLEAMRGEGIGDILGVAQPSRDHREALCFTVLLEAGVRTEGRLARRWAILARHLGALADARAWLDAEHGEGACDAPPERCEANDEC